MTSSLRTWMKDAVTIAALGAAVAGVGTLADRTAGAQAQTAPVHAPALVRFADVPSHGGLYRASLVPAPGALAVGREVGAELEVRSAEGAAVEGATLALESWLPDFDRDGAAQPRVVRELGRGRYAVEGLRFDQPGWWNVKLAVSASAGTDSLAFNVVF